MIGKSVARGIAAFFLAQTLLTGAALAQFQTCVYCDVMPFTPDPFPVRPCDIRTISIGGIGYQDRLQNGCSATPVVMVRSTRPDRATILSFRVMSDSSIEFSYQVPCGATPGLLGIDVTIDDDPSDSIVPYACGNARMFVEQLIFSVGFDRFDATRTWHGVEVAWLTASEDHALGFEVWGRDAAGVSTKLPGVVYAHGPGLTYSFRDASPEARTRVAYQVVEINDSGNTGDSTPWVAVVTAGEPGSSGRKRRGR